MEKPNHKDERIFVVDDNPNNLGVVAEYLKSAGYKVSVAPNGSVALERTARINPAVILLDIKMPDINGFDVCRRLKASTETADIPVIFLTALDDPHNIARGFQAGGTDYLSKPVNKDELLARVSTHVENYLYRNNLKQQVALRTAELERSNRLLKQEIDRRREIEAELRISEERLDLALYSANEGIWDWDLKSGAIFFDKRYYTMAGYEHNAFAGAFEQWENRVHPDDIESSKKAISDYLSGETPSFETEFRFRRKDGTYMWIRGKGKIVARDNRGNPTRFIGTHSDITERKQAEQELQKAKNLISNIINSMPSSLIGVDVNGCVTHWNNTIEQSTGIHAQTAKGRFISDLLPWMSSELDKITESIRTRQIIQKQRKSRPQDNVPRFEDMTIYPLIANGVEGAVIRIDDVTHKIRMEEMMIQSEKMLSVGGLAAGMAHEINNPLAGMMQTADVMARRLIDDPTIPANREAAEAAGTTIKAIQNFMDARGILRMVDTIKESGHRVATIVENMLSFARKSDTMFSTHRIEELLDRTLALAATDYDLKKKYDFKGIDIVKSYATDVPAVPCENAKIQQVFLNIFQNAAQAMQIANVATPRLFIKTGYDSSRDLVFAEIKDNGPGMDESIRKRVFEPFFTTKPAGLGTGLGLSVSYFIITENHQGEMAVESEPGSGATFIIRLPVNRKNQ